MASPTEHFCSIQVNVDSQEIFCSLTRGLTVFGILIAAKGDYDDFFPPVTDQDLFVELRFDKRPSEDTIWNLFEAYLFELSTSSKIDLALAPRPNIADIILHWPNAEDNPQETFTPRLRPLLLGDGMAELLRLYNRAIKIPDFDIQILYLTKVIEYISQTVVRAQAIETIRAKLLSPSALQPDAKFISELEILIEEQRSFRKDSEAIKLTIVTCCEASELAKVAPPFLAELKRISVTTKSKEREQALGKLGSSLYATRNSIAHAKANYIPTGEECPEKELPDFAQCIKLASQQAILWYHSRPEFTRVI